MTVSHGLSKTLIYKVWLSMRNRCYYAKGKYYRYYGARGITVCDSWKLSFEAFYKDMGDRPSPKHSLDRIDNSKGYSKDNCRWATLSEQHGNTRYCKFITYKGETKIIAEWSKVANISANSIYKRRAAGWTPEQIFEIPAKGERIPRIKRS